ncbi:MAG: 6,7-dimethyl-8-ribityllumazine synthase [Zetaproteobacteria bacterium]|nr:MAG: 6,7-dimethyl-8-ribityllumazine synthase [Zetaproteobacteria bacterium]
MSLDAPRLGGAVDASGLRIGIVVSRFNGEITEALLEGAVNTLKEHGASDSDMRVVHVPGALEIGAIASRMAQSGQYDAVVCLGCVIRGGTAHFEHVCRGAMDVISNTAQRGDIGVGNGVLTVDTIEQARDRVGGRHGHKGAEAALTAVEMAHLLREVPINS